MNLNFIDHKEGWVRSRRYLKINIGLLARANKRRSNASVRRGLSFFEGQSLTNGKIVDESIFRV